MKIDWFTVIAQGVNLFILVWLLKRFLYKPVLQAVKERETRIEQQVKEAEERNAEALKMQEALRQQQQELTKHRAALIAKTEEEVNAQRSALMEEVRKESVTLKSKLQESLQQEQQRLGEDMGRMIQQEVFAVTRKVLNDIASADLDQQIAFVFMDRLKGLDGEEKQKLVSALKAEGDVVVRSTSPLAPALKEKITGEIKTLFPQVNVQFTSAPENMTGIELLTNSYRLSWTIGDYLSSLESKVGVKLPEQPEADLYEHK